MYLFLGEDKEAEGEAEGAPAPDGMASLFTSLMPQEEPKNAREARKQARKTTAVSAGGGAVAGATIGLALGPLGALVGALVGGAGGGIYGLINEKKSKKKAKKKQQQEIAAIQAAQASEKAKQQALAARELQERTRLRQKFLTLRSNADNILRQLQQRLSSLQPKKSYSTQAETTDYEEDFSHLIEFFELYKEELEEVIKVGQEHLENQDEDGLDTLALQLNEIKAEITSRLSEYRPMYVQTGALQGYGPALSGDSCGASCDCAPCKVTYASSNVSGLGVYSLLHGSNSRGLAGDDLGDWLAETRATNRKNLGLPPLARGLSGFEIGANIETAGAALLVGALVYACCKA